MHSLRYPVAFILLFVASIVPVEAQKPAKKTTPVAAPAAPAAPAAMTNDDVIALAGTGLPDEVVDAKIHAAPSTAFDTSVAGLKALKAGGVSSGVIRYMIDPSAPVAPAPAPAVAVANPDDPATAHSPGVYIFAPGNDGVVHLTKLDHITPKTSKTSGAFLSGMTYGLAKAHTKALVDGAHASVQTVDVNPVFYAYIPEDNNSFGGATISVRDLTLIKFDPKESTREINTATFSPWGASVGTDQKAKQGFSSETIKPGIYKLTLDQPLPPRSVRFPAPEFRCVLRLRYHSREVIAKTIGLRYERATAQATETRAQEASSVHPYVSAERGYESGYQGGNLA